MRTSHYGDGGDVPAFTVEPSNEIYWLLRLCYQEVLRNEEKRSAGMQDYEIDGNELYASEGRFDGFAAYLSGWLQGAVAANQAGQPITPFDYNAVPDLIELLYICLTGNWGLVFVLFIKVGIKFLIDYIQRSLPPDTDVSEVAQKMDSIFIDKTDPLDVRNRIADLIDALHLATPSVVVNTQEYSVDSVGDVTYE